MSRKLILFSTLLIFSLLIACNLPSSQPKELFPTATPDLTTTAIIAQATLLTQQAPGSPSETAAAPLPPAATATQVMPQPPTAVQPATAVPQVPIVPITVVPPTSVPPTSVPVTQPTAVPTRTNMVRAGDVISARYLTTPPTIDGVYEDWATNRYAIGYVVYGAGNWTGAADLSGDVQVGWDDNNLYLSVRVTDDVYVQQAAGADIYKGDSIELLFDKDLYADFYTSGLSADDFQLGISPGNPNTGGTKEAYLWFPRTIEGSRTSKIAIASSSASGSYVVEAAIPWTVLETKPAANMGYGIGISVSDNDLPSTANQQTLISTAKNRSLVNPMTWNQLYLIK